MMMACWLTRVFTEGPTAGQPGGHVGGLFQRSYRASPIRLSTLPGLLDERVQ